MMPRLILVLLVLVCAAAGCAQRDTANPFVGPTETGPLP